MKNRFFLLILFVVTLLQSLLAVPARPGWRVYKTNDGSSVTLQMVGDEFGHWLEDSQGVAYVLMDDGTVVVSEKSVEQLNNLRKASPRYLESRPQRSIGTINLAPRGIVILVNYDDVEMKSGNTQSAFNQMMNGTNYTYGNTHNSVREYFRSQSRGLYVPDFDVYGPVKLQYGYAHYGANKDNARGEDMYAGDVVVEAVKAVNTQYDVDFNLYNNDGDDEIDFVYIIYAGKGEADGGAAATIWPHNWNLYSARYFGNCTYSATQCMVDGLYINNYAMSGELCGSTSDRTSIGTICHEFGHVLGLPDFYDTSYGSNYSNKVTPRGYDIMDSGSYNGEDSNGVDGCGTCPPNYSPWERIYLGWDTPVNPGNTPANLTLYPSEDSNYKCYQINALGTYQVCTTEGVNYYIENRQQTGWDSDLPGHGMLIWRVDYNSTYWKQNKPNYSDYGNPHCTLVSAYGTAISSNDNTFPGNKSVTSWTSSPKPITSISESNGIVTAAYLGGASASNHYAQTLSYYTAVNNETAGTDGDYSVYLYTPEGSLFAIAEIVTGNNYLLSGDYAIGGNAGALYDSQIRLNEQFYDVTSGNISFKYLGKSSENEDMYKVTGHNWYIPSLDKYYDMSGTIYGNAVWKTPFVNCGYNTNCDDVVITLTEQEPNPKSGVCGDHLVWSLDDDETVLTIEGYGDMYDFTFTDANNYTVPWLASWRTIQQVIMPEGMTKVGDFAFFSCQSVVSADIPSTVTTLGQYAFAGVLCTEIHLPDALTTIGDYAFVYCPNITSFTFPENVTSVGEEIFYDNPNLTSIVWNARNCASPASDSQSPFIDVCTQITSFVIGEGVESIPAYLFYSMSNLTSITFPASLLSIGDDAMTSSGITSIRSEAVNPPAWSGYSGSGAGMSVTVPCGRVPAYKAAATWSLFNNYATYGDQFPFTLAVGVQTEGTGTATVTTAPDCSANTAVITATPADHYHFVRWADEESSVVSAGAVRSVVVTEDLTFTAVFEEDTKYTVTVNDDGHGTAAADKPSYYAGETAVLTATADEGYIFDQWSDGAFSNPREIVVTENIVLTAMFKQDVTGVNTNFAEHPFTVGDNERRIVFSQANLQFQASSQTFRFANNQYDYIGAYNVQIADDYSGWIDLFGWGTGTQPTAHECKDCGNYFENGGNLDDPDDTFDAPARRNAPQNDNAYSAFVDWGINSIVNGGNTAGVWRTMTADEWNYLFYSREDASSKFGFATVNGVKGLVVLPDDWELPAECTFVASIQAGLEAVDSYFSNTSADNFTHNIYNSAQWIKMEAAGAVFLPAAGSRLGKTYDAEGTDGYYWSSTANDEITAFTVFFDNEFFYTSTSRSRAQGYSVRLVKEQGHTHDWGEPTYAWNDGYTQCTATRVCKRDASHVEEETVNATIETVDATCETEGTDTHTAVFTNEAFAEQVHTETVAALGHDWGEPTYAWNADYSQCTATRVCISDASHVETETVSSVAETTPASGTEDGYVTYTATFTNEAFETQVYTQTITALPSNIVLQENETDEYYTWFAENYNGVKVTSATLNRQFKQGVWSTLCLPFDVRKSPLTALGLNGRIYEFRYTEKVDESTIQIFFSNAQSIQAGKGYIVNANAKLAAKTSFVFPSVTINTDADIQSGYDIMALSGYNSVGNIFLVGTFRKGKVFSTQGGTTFYGLSSNQIKKVKDGTDFPAYRGFLRSEVPLNAQRVRIVVEGEPVVEMEVVNGEIVNAEDAVKYIENGVLYIRRNGKLYNAVGAELQ